MSTTGRKRPERTLQELLDDDQTVPTAWVQFVYPLCGVVPDWHVRDGVTGRRTM